MSLPIRYSPVKMRVRDESIPAVEGAQSVFKKKVYDSYIIDARRAGRGRPREATLAEAMKTGKSIARDIAQNGQKVMTLPPEECRIYLAAKKALAPFGIAVDEGARQLGEILKALDGESFHTVHQAYKASGQKLKLGATTREIYQDYLTEQEVVRGNGEYDIRDVERWVGGFVEVHTGEIIPITTDQIDIWLKGLGGKARSKNNARDHVIAFFNFAQQKDHLPKSHDHAAVGTTPFKDARKKITTEEEARDSIEKVEPERCTV